jgi:hypothetical protein
VEVNPTLSKKIRQRQRMCEEQRWRCWYCNRTMRWIVMPSGQRPPRDMATTEHLDDRFSPRRGQAAPGERRHVAACYGCNQARSRARVRQQARMAQGAKA